MGKIWFYGFPNISNNKITIQILQNEFLFYIFQLCCSFTTCVVKVAGGAAPDACNFGPSQSSGPALVASFNFLLIKMHCLSSPIARHSCSCFRQRFAHYFDYCPVEQPTAILAWIVEYIYFLCAPKLRDHHCPANGFDGDLLRKGVNFTRSNVRFIYFVFIAFFFNKARQINALLDCAPKHVFDLESILSAAAKERALLNEEVANAIGNIGPMVFVTVITLCIRLSFVIFANFSVTFGMIQRTTEFSTSLLFLYARAATKAILLVRVCNSGQRLKDEVFCEPLFLNIID
jgi:hypothetical protein